MTVEDIKSVQVAFGGGYNIANLAARPLCPWKKRKRRPILLAYPFFLGFYIFIAIMDNPALQILDSPDIQ